MPGVFFWILECCDTNLDAAIERPCVRGDVQAVNDCDSDCYGRLVSR